MNEKFKKWAFSAAMRAIRTMAQSALAIIGTDMIGLLDVQWLAVASSALMAGVTSVLMSVVLGIPEAKDENGNGIPDDME